MKILALETAAKAVSAAVTEDGKVLASAYQDTGLTHSRTLMPLVELLMRNTDQTLAEMDAIAVSAGPGSFTGVRIGVSAAKGLAFAAEKPCAAVSTLGALARNLAFQDGLIICAMDARRQQVYNALFEAREGRLIRLTPDRAIALAELAEELRSDTRPKTVLGDGGRMCFGFLTEAGVSCRLAPPHLLMQNAMSVALEAEDLAQAGKLVTAQALAPVYLRPPQAERLRREKLAESGT